MFWLLFGVGVMIASAIARTYAKPDPLRTAGASLDLAYAPSTSARRPLLQGTVNGLQIRVQLLDTEQPQILYRVFYPDLGIALRMARLDNMARLMDVAADAEEYALGDEAFDALFRINTARPEAFKKMIKQDLRDRLLRLAKTHPDVVIEDREMSLVTEAEDLTPVTIVDTIDTLVVAAVLLGVNRPGPAADLAD